MVTGDREVEDAASPQCLVVMYHYVRHRDPLFADGITGLGPGEFEAQLDQLCSLFEPIDWPTLLSWTTHQRSIPERCFLLTFDDGLADHARVVFPILERRGLRGVFFVPGEILTKQRMLPAHSIHLLLASLGYETFQEELLRYLADRDSKTDWTAKVERQEAEAMYAYEPPQRAWLKHLLTMVLPRELRVQAVDALFEKHIGSLARWSHDWYLGWDDLVRMESKGHTIGGHGHGHEALPRLSPADRRHDVQLAAAILNEGLGRDLRPFSYPYGCFTDDVCQACQDAGFAHAFTTERHFVAAGCDPMRLPRIDTIYVDSVLREKTPCAQVLHRER